MKSLLILYSYPHHNTEKIAKVIANIIDAQIKTPQQIKPDELQDYDLVGFGSGIYSAKHHSSLFDLADNLPQVTNKKAFLFSTCGAPAFAVNEGRVDEYLVKVHAPIRSILESKGYEIVDDFMCLGWNTNSFLKLFGGINKGRSNDNDLKNAELFAHNVLKKS
ncbi:MAG: flavodoxin family protein [Candidatus Thermoplasmatota archaeon]|nr:flavodoxin family protein [Candidatus Thermoplasmatota archaeon]